LEATERESWGEKEKGGERVRRRAEVAKEGGKGMIMRGAVGADQRRKGADASPSGCSGL
jgi:hypothetical protein